MTLDLWLVLGIALVGLADVWIGRLKDRERRRFSRERGQYGQISQSGKLAEASEKRP